MSNALYKDNLKAEGWYYGSIQEQDYKLQMFELATKYNVSTCPLNRPFANFQLNKCTSCKQAGAVFNLGFALAFIAGSWPTWTSPTPCANPALPALLQRNVQTMRHLLQWLFPQCHIRGMLALPHGTVFRLFPREVYFLSWQSRIQPYFATLSTLQLNCSLILQCK